MKNKKSGISHILFCDELIGWLQAKGFTNDRGWNKEMESGMHFFFHL